MKSEKRVERTPFSQRVPSPPAATDFLASLNMSLTLLNAFLSLSPVLSLTSSVFRSRSLKLKSEYSAAI